MPRLSRESRLLVLLVVACSVVLQLASDVVARDPAVAPPPVSVSEGQRRAVYDIERLRRREKCLGKNATKEVRGLEYNGSVHNVSVAYANWASARVTGEISYILLSEVMGYRAHLLDTKYIYSTHPINYAAGCVDADDATGSNCDVNQPLVHLTVETWMAGYRRATSELPESIRPHALSTMSYPLLDTFFIWPDVRDDAINTRCRLYLDDYRAYKEPSNGSDCAQPASFFDSWQDVHAKLTKRRISTDIIEKCTDMDKDDTSNRNAERYVELTGDGHTTCHLDQVWFSPACRHNTSQCVPLVVQYTMDFAMQISFFLDLPMAIFMVSGGDKGDYAEYYEIIRESKLMFGWYTPDDNLLRNGALPVMVNMPRTNHLEHLQGIYKTGLAVNNPRNFAWRNLPSVSRHISHFGAKVNFYEEEVDSMMRQSRQRKDALAARAEGPQERARLAGLGFTTSQPLEEMVARDIACDWVKTNQERWKAWIPPICRPGSAADEALAKCKDCIAGYFCGGGELEPQQCPPGYFCPPGTAEPVPCRSGWTSEAGALSRADCDACRSGTVRVGSTCMLAYTLVVVVVLPVVLGSAAAAAIYTCHNWLKQRKAFIIPYDRVIFGERLRHIGTSIRGHAGSKVFAGTYDGTDVAVKFLTTPAGDSSALGPPTQVDDLDASVIDRTQGEDPGDGVGCGSGVDSDVETGRCSATCVPSSKHRTRNSNFLQVVQVEMRRLCALRHSNVVTYIGFQLDNHQVMVIMELMQYGSLYDMLRNETLALDDDMVPDILHDITQGMNYLHTQSPPILHRFLSTTNVLLDHTLTAKVADSAYPRVGKRVATHLARVRSTHYPFEDGDLGADSAVSSGDAGGHNTPDRFSSNSLNPFSKQVRLVSEADGNGDKATNAQRRHSGSDSVLNRSRSSGLQRNRSSSVASQSEVSNHVSSIRSNRQDESWVTPAVMYMAPEILTGEDGGRAVDVYAFGILVYEVMMRCDLFAKLSAGCSPVNAPSMIVRVLCELAEGDFDHSKYMPIPTGINPSLAGLCRDCCHFSGQKRPTFSEAARRLKALMTTDVHAGSHMNLSSLAIASRASGRREPMMAKRDSRRMKQQHHASEKLLLQVFPWHVSQALKENRKVEPETFPCVTIFFSDVVGFTEMASGMEPHLVMDMLDRLYTKFDLLSEKYDVFKVETIGDSYMAVSNLHRNQAADHALRIACFAQAAVEAANHTPIDLMDSSKGCVRVRVGFHCGPVVATVVGRKNPRYCLFGDAVNTASRMETNSDAGKVLCSADAHALLHVQGVQVTPGIVPFQKTTIIAKGKGTLTAHWVSDLEDPFLTAKDRQEITRTKPVFMPASSVSWNSSFSSRYTSGLSDAAEDSQTQRKEEQVPCTWKGVWFREDGADEAKRRTGHGHENGFCAPEDVEIKGTHFCVDIQEDHGGRGQLEHGRDTSENIVASGYECEKEDAGASEPQSQHAPERGANVALARGAVDGTEAGENSEGGAARQEHREGQEHQEGADEEVQWGEITNEHFYASASA